MTAQSFNLTDTLTRIMHCGGLFITVNEQPEFQNPHYQSERIYQNIIEQDSSDMKNAVSNLFSKKPTKSFLSNLLIITLSIVLLSSALFPAACVSRPTPAGSLTSDSDQEWLRSLDQYLSLAYVEHGDQAAFTALSSKALSPSLYSTYNILRMLKFTGAEIKNPDQIIAFINSTKNPSGYYLDPFQSLSSHRPDYETMEAIKILISLNARIEDADSIAEYLLSLAYDDGTFLTDSSKKVTPSDDTRIERIGRGTFSVINSLVSLNLSE
ncbi:MAG: hypothetical protein NUV31_09410, partial [Dehalococcoidales bacterium]|nr:hypothetical protein [Dehalococcoidales bacterium]